MNTLAIGSSMPGFKNLEGVDGNQYSSDDFRDNPYLLVIFSCNHCPYVQAYEDRMISLATQYKSRGLAVVAVNSNEDQNYPEDSFEEMVKRAKEKDFPYPYVRDEDQSVAKAYKATHTPEFFLFDADRKLRYHGRLDDNWREPDKVTQQYIRDAIDALIEGKEVAEPEVHSIGCTIKWR
jgi:peroxiredoxin